MRAGLFAAAAVATALTGCGGDDDKKTPTTGASPVDVAQAGTKARADAQNASLALEACYAENQDYTTCGTPEVLDRAGVELGKEPGQVEISDPKPTSYKLTAYVTGGKGFSIEKAEDGTMKRSCDAPPEAGCMNETW